MNIKRLVLIVICIFFTTSNAFALPSLDPKDQVILSIRDQWGEQQSLIAFKDHQDSNLYYLVPQNPYLEVKKKGKITTPVFRLLKYQHLNTETQNIEEGGILNFSLSFGIKTPQMAKAKTSLKAYLKNKKIKVTLLPLKAENLAVFSPKGERLAETSGSLKGLAGAYFRNSVIPFMLEFNRLDTDILEELISGTTGLLVMGNFSFEGITPALGCKVTVNWDETYKSFTQNTSLSASMCRIFMDLGTKVDFQSARDTLIKNGSLKVESTTGNNFTEEEFNRITQPVIEKMMKEMTTGLKFSDKIPTEIIDNSEKENQSIGDKIVGVAETIGDTAMALSPYGILWGNDKLKTKINFSYVAKDIKRVRKGTQIFDYSKRTIVNQRSLLNTFVSIRRFKNQKSKLIKNIEPGNWHSSYFTLPAVGDCEYLGIKNIDITVTPTFKRKSIKNIKSVNARYTSRSECWKIKRNEIEMMIFPLAWLYDDKKYSENTDQLEFKVDTTIVPARQPWGKQRQLAFTKYIPIFNGNIPMTEPEELIEVIDFKTRRLHYIGDDQIGVEALSGRLYCDKTKISFELDENEPRASIIIPIGTQVKAKIYFEICYKNAEGRIRNKRIPWENNDKNLLELDAYSSFRFYNSMFEDKLPKGAIYREE